MHRTLRGSPVHRFTGSEVMGDGLGHPRTVAFMETPHLRYGHDPANDPASGGAAASQGGSESEVYNPWTAALPLLSGHRAPLADGGLVSDVHGWKVARLLDPVAGIFGGYAFGTYGFSSVSSCERRRNHVAPTNGCECGFNAMKDKQDAVRLLERWRGFVLLEVDLFGTVIEHRTGWRAQEQDVLRVHVPLRCARGRCQETTVGFRLRRNRWFPSCGMHLGVDGVELSVLRRHGVDVVLEKF